MHSVSGGPGRPPALIQEAVHQLGPCAVEFLWEIPVEQADLRAAAWIYRALNFPFFLIFPWAPVSSWEGNHPNQASRHTTGAVFWEDHILCESGFSFAKGTQFPMDSVLSDKNFASLWNVFFMFQTLAELKNHIFIFPLLWGMLMNVFFRQQMIEVVHKMLRQFSEWVIPASGKSHKIENSQRTRLINHLGWSSLN